MSKEIFRTVHLTKAEADALTQMLVAYVKHTSGKSVLEFFEHDVALGRGFISGASKIAGYPVDDEGHPVEAK